MALRLFTGFYMEQVSKWAATTNWALNTITAPRAGSTHATLSSSASTASALTKLLDSQSKYIVGFAWRCTSNRGATQIFAFKNSVGNQISIWQDANLYLQVYRGGDSTKTLLFDGAGDARFLLDITLYSYIEFMVEFSDTGSFTLRIDGLDSKSVTQTSVDTTQQTEQSADRVTWGYASGPTTQICYLDDVYICDGTGSDNNTLLGNCKVDYLIPNAEGTTQNFTPSTGTAHYSLVDDNLTVGDYVSDATVNDIELFNVTGLSVTPLKIYAAKVINHMQASDAGAKLVSNIVNVGSTNYEGASQALTVLWNNLEDTWLTNPATSADWIRTDLDAIQIGVKNLS